MYIVVYNFHVLEKSDEVDTTHTQNVYTSDVAGSSQPQNWLLITPQKLQL